MHDAVDRTTRLVEEGHESSARSVVRVLGAVEPAREPVRVVDGVRRVATAGVLGTIRVANRAVEAVTDAGLDAALAHRPTVDGAPLPGRSDVLGTRGWWGDAALGLLNGAIGDHLHARDNALDLGMSFRHEDAYLTLEPAAVREAMPAPSGRVAVFVHGLGTTEWSWWLGAADYHGDPGASFGTLLARDHGYTPVYVRYNTGRHVSENGRRLAFELGRLLEAYPAPVEELLLVGHSMGGLVVRSACHYGAQDGLAWPALVRRVFCLGSPHHGAPLEKLGHLATATLAAIDTPATRITARVIAGRSAGVKDMRHGALVDEDWLGRDPDALLQPDLLTIPLLPHVEHHFVSATVTRDPDHPLGALVGDLVVRPPSASGARVERRSFPIETSRYGGVLHHQLQNHPSVYATLRDALAPGPGPSAGPVPAPDRVTER